MNELDLHGYKVHDAWKEFSQYIQQCYLDEIKTTTIITGHGKIAEEIIAWVYANQYCKTKKQHPAKRTKPSDKKSPKRNG